MFIKEVINWYLKYYVSLTNQGDNDLRSNYNGTSSSFDKAELLLMGNHQWYLNVFHKNIMLNVINYLIKTKPWLKTYKNCCFEDVYKDVLLLKGPYIQQLTIYDIALRIAIVKNQINLLPSKYVYLHATPMAAYKWLYKNGVVLLKIKGFKAIIDISSFMGVFNPLDARQIEDMLCHLEKGIIRRKKGNQFKSIDVKDVELDNIFKKYFP